MDKVSNLVQEYIRHHKQSQGISQQRVSYLIARKIAKRCAKNSTRSA